MKRSQFIQLGLGAIPFLPDVSVEEDSFEALFVTDMHLSPEIKAAENAIRFLKSYLQTNKQIRILINGGDTVYDVAKLSPNQGMKQWDWWRKIQDEISIPVFNCIGNHDIYEWEKEPSLKDPVSSKDIALSYLSMPSSYYSFSFGSWTFIVLDSCEYAGEKGYKAALGEEQIKWLQSTLEENKHQPVCIISHIPLISACEALYLPTGRSYLYPSIMEKLKHPDASAVFDVFNKSVKLILHGHLHLQEEIYYKDIRIYNGGAFSGNLWQGDFQGFSPIFSRIRFSKNGQTVIEKVEIVHRIYYKS